MRIPGLIGSKVQPKSLHSEEEVLLSAYESIEQVSALLADIRASFTSLDSIGMLKDSDAIAMRYNDSGLESLGHNGYNTQQLQSATEGIMSSILDAIIRFFEWIKDKFFKQEVMAAAVKQAVTALEENLKKLDFAKIEKASADADAKDIIIWKRKVLLISMKDALLEYDKLLGIIAAVSAVLKKSNESMARRGNDAISAFSLIFTLGLATIADASDSANGKEPADVVPEADALRKLLLADGWKIENHHLIAPPGNRAANKELSLIEHVQNLKASGYATISNKVGQMAMEIKSVHQILDANKSMLNSHVPNNKNYDNHFIRYYAEMTKIVSHCITEGHYIEMSFLRLTRMVSQNMPADDGNK